MGHPLNNNIPNTKGVVPRGRPHMAIRITINKQYEYRISICGNVPMGNDSSNVNVNVNNNMNMIQ